MSDKENDIKIEELKGLITAINKAEGEETIYWSISCGEPFQTYNKFIDFIEYLTSSINLLEYGTRVDISIIAKEQFDNVQSEDPEDRSIVGINPKN